MEKLGVETAVIKTVFAYKINVAIAAILIFLNIQAFMSVLMATDDALPIIVGILLCVACFIYGFLSLNGYLTKIIVYEGGFAIKSPLRKTIVHEDKIKKATFRRVNIKKIIINVSIHDGRDIEINSAKYGDITPLIDYLKQFK
ncbi:MAG: hypothetical protein FWC76_00845 [Defluviitaleaceae bacterium]|nr:hypothetical protein [Defluviitaleaceae bacterium]